MFNNILNAPISSLDLVICRFDRFRLSAASLKAPTAVRQRNMVMSPGGVGTKPLFWSEPAAIQHSVSTETEKFEMLGADTKKRPRKA
jgi:hypothetical protein